MHLCNISHNANFYLNVNLYLSQQEQSEFCQTLKDHPRCRLSSTGVSGKNAIFKYRFVIIKFHIPKSAAWYFKSNKTPLPVFPQISCQLGISEASFDYMAGNSEGDRQQVWHFCPLTSCSLSGCWNSTSSPSSSTSASSQSHKLCTSPISAAPQGSEDLSSSLGWWVQIYQLTLYRRFHLFTLASALACTKQ